MNINLRSFKINCIYLLKWISISIFFGIFIGFIGTIFGKVILSASIFWQYNDYSIYLLLISGLLIIKFYNFLNEENFKTSLVFDSINSSKKISIKPSFLVVVPAVLTHFTAGSSGKEGSSLVVGASIASFFADLFKFNEFDKKIAIMCGMSACFSALFGIPLGIAIFCIEVINVGNMNYYALIPCIISSYIAVNLARFFNYVPVKFLLLNNYDFNLKTVFFVVLLSIVCSIVVILFCYLLTNLSNIYKTHFKNPYTRILLGALLFILLTLLIGKEYSGGDVLIIKNSFNASISYYAFIFRMIFALVILVAGYKGGEIMPTLAIGATLGSAFAMVFGLNVELYCACGMIACFVGITNVPIASIFMAIELFGINGLPYYVISVVICFILSGKCGIYSGSIKSGVSFHQHQIL